MGQVTQSCFLEVRKRQSPCRSFAPLGLLAFLISLFYFRVPPSPRAVENQITPRIVTAAPATGARLSAQDRLHSPHPARSSAPLRQAPVRPHPSANCNSGESPLRHSQCEPATWPCLRPRKLLLDRHA